MALECGLDTPNTVSSCLGLGGGERSFDRPSQQSQQGKTQSVQQSMRTGRTRNQQPILFKPVPDGVDRSEHHPNNNRHSR
jgi:hypothetical protein